MVLTLLRCDWRSRHSLNLSDAKLKPITTWSPAFSRALDSLFGFTLSSHWYLEEFFFPPNGGCDYFVVGLLTLNRKALSLVTKKASLYHTKKNYCISESRFGIQSLNTLQHRGSRHTSLNSIVLQTRLRVLLTNSFWPPYNRRASNLPA